MCAASQRKSAIMCPAASQRKLAAKRRGSATKQKYRPTIIGLIHSLWYRYRNNLDLEDGANEMLSQAMYCSDGAVSQPLLHLDVLSVLQFMIIGK